MHASKISSDEFNQTSDLLLRRLDEIVVERRYNEDKLLKLVIKENELKLLDSCFPNNAQIKEQLSENKQSQSCTKDRIERFKRKKKAYEHVIKDCGIAGEHLAADKYYGVK